MSEEYEGCIDKNLLNSLSTQEYLGIPEIDINKNDRNNCSRKRGKWLKQDLE